MTSIFLLFFSESNLNTSVCPDCPGEYNPEELTWALITLGIVTSVFLSICFCRCYPKFKLIFSNNSADSAKLRCVNKSVPPVPINNLQTNHLVLNKMEERYPSKSPLAQPLPYDYKYVAHLPQGKIHLCQI